MSFTKSLFGRELGLRQFNRLDAIESAFKELSVSRQYVFNDFTEVGAPPLALSLNGKLLSVANDGGDVALIDKNTMKESKKWMAHNNAIFDVKWRTDFDNHLGTASGDKSIIIWDINTEQKLYSYDFAHNGSIKSIDFKDQNVLASGSRDGFIKIWDLRCGRGGSVIVIESAHLSKLPSAKSPRALKSPKVNKPPKSSPLNSVTCVIFNQLTDQLYSSGANDGTIKVWDLRKCRRSKVNKSVPTPLRELYQHSKRGSPSHGFSSLVFDPNYRLFASCSDHNIYGYSHDKSWPSIVCVGAKFNNFTRIGSFGANYLVSGSSNGKSMVWSLNANQFKDESTTKVSPICSLSHSDEEVTAVVSDSDWFEIYTCSDDQNVTKWSLFNPNLRNDKIIKSEVFVPEITEIEVKFEPKNILTPPLNKALPFSSIMTNWLETSGKQHTTPSNPSKRLRLTQSTPTNKRHKENHSKPKSSKKLFYSNRKINEYFTH